jgi:alkylhydroperoxidase family enzyme
MEEDVKDLLNFEKSTRYDERQKAALTLAQAITWGTDLNEGEWETLYKHLNKEQLTELGFFIEVTMGQQRFNRLLGGVWHRTPLRTQDNIQNASAEIPIERVRENGKYHSY